MPDISHITFNLTDYLLILMMIICIGTDIKNRRIYNKVLFPFLLAGLVVNFISGSWHGLIESVEGFSAGLVLLIIPFAKGGIGGGDVKLLATIGSIKGPAFVLTTFMSGAIAGGILAIALLVRHRRLLATISGGLAAASNLLIRYGIVFGLAGRREEAAEPLHLPYSLALGAGVLASYYIGLQNLLG